MTENNPIICRCEGVYLSDMKEAIRGGATAAPGLKMRNRAGMGACQGRVCQQIISDILRAELGSDVQPKLQISRSPVRPTLLKDF